MNHATAAKAYPLGSSTGNLIGPEASPYARLLGSLNNSFEIAAVVATDPVAEALEKLKHGTRSARLMCPGSGGFFCINWAAPGQQMTTFQIPDWIQSSLLDACQKQLFDRLDTLRNKVRSYKESDDIDWPTDQACEDAKTFIRHLPLHEIHVPEIYFAHDGEVNFLWEEADIGLEVDLGFYGDGTYSYFATDGNGNKLKKDDVDVEQELPGDLADMLKV